MGTFLGDNDFNKDKIMTVLNHKDSQVTSIYNRSNQFKQKLEALNFWNEHLINKDIGGGRAFKRIREWSQKYFRIFLLLFYSSSVE